MTGRIMNFHPPGAKPWNPEVGNKPIWTETIMMSIKANQNWGIDIVAKDRTLTVRSMIPRGRLAASIPKGIPYIPVIQATIARRAVVGRR